jgi:hypothetical protein
MLQHIFHSFTQALGDMHTPATDANERKLILRAELFDNFGRHPCQNKVYFSHRHQKLALGFFHYKCRAVKYASVETGAIISHRKMRCKGLVTTYTELG